MIRKIFTLMLVICAIKSFGAMYPMYWFNSGNQIASPCANIPGTMNDGWELYQTENNLYDGIHIDAFCGVSNWWSFQYADADLTKAVFCRYLVEDIPLSSNQTYTFNTYNLFQELIDFENQEFCLGGLCQGIILEIEVPDDPNDSDDLPEIRHHQLEAVMIDGSIQFPCFASEYFSGQKIVSFIIKFFPQTVSGTVYFDAIEMWESDNNIEVSSTFLEQSVLGNYISLNQGFNANYLVKHDPLSFPSAENITFAEAQSDVDNTSAQDITIFVDNYSFLAFQPYTDIRGKLVEGSETERHNLIIYLNNANVCITYGFFEVIMKPGDELAVNKGNLLMNRSSCIRIEKDATLRVKENSQLNYGFHGEGMLALNSGCNVVLEENAKVVFNSIFSIWENAWEDYPNDIEITLNPGNQLIFGPQAQFVNKSLDNRMKLVIHQQGGYLDVSNLSEEEKQHIEIVYEEPSSSFAILTHALQADNMFLALHATNSFISNFSILDLNGKLIKKGQINVNSGYNSIHIDLPVLALGTYFISFDSPFGSQVLKFISQ